MAESLPSSLCIIEKAKAPVMRNTGGFVVLCQSLCYTGTAALLRSPSRGKEVNPMENKDEKNEELLNKQLQLLAEKSLNADADTLVSLTDVMCKVYKVLNGDF